ncbi:hypothetical protein [Cupriavidus plantarum]|uniref:hypothetical protein n=1 Tax=Cupriavidus plantarum TaxID=942865 RepID=UPI000F1E7CE2|nr:hypothetical protein [Cupriavidus plantarum]RLK35512.1 hypothetical protein C7417_3282 [Cupriavidus plantarum]
MNKFDPKGGTRMRSTACMHLALAILASVAFISLLSVFLTPIWETNDDVGMSMIAHGYGFVADGSPNLIFSNVLWGHIVRAMPQFGDVFGYTIASTLVIAASCAAILYFLMRSGVTPVHALLAGGIIFLWPILFPQFTLNSGLLAVAAVLGWRAYAETLQRLDLVLATVLGFLSYLIRNQEFWLVLAVSVPLYPWKLVLRNRAMQVALVLLALAIIGAASLNKAAYDTSAWKKFAEFNQARAPYTDFRAGDQIRNRPDVLQRHGYSSNDIDLIGGWFFVDARLSDPARLNAMLGDVGLRNWVQRGFGLGLESLRLLMVDRLWPMLACALLIALISPSRRMFLLMVAVAAAVFALGAIGRPGVTRVQYPLCALVLLVAVRSTRSRTRLTRGVAALALAGTAAIVVHAVWPYQVEAVARIKSARVQLQQLPKGMLAVWGASFPYEAAFPPFDERKQARAVEIYPMGVTTGAPFSIAMKEEAAGRGFLARLTSASGMNVSVSPVEVELLRTYCKEHFDLQLVDKLLYQHDGLIIHNVKCERPVTS